MLFRYPATHPFASLQGSDNIIKFTTKYFPNGVIIQVKKRKKIINMYIYYGNEMYSNNVN